MLDSLMILSAAGSSFCCISHIYSLARAYVNLDQTEHATSRSACLQTFDGLRVNVVP